MKSVALYLRQSLDRALHQAKDKPVMETELAVKRQRAECLEVCQSNPLTQGREVVEYCDNDKSATNRKKKRPEFERLLADIEAGKVDTVVCWDKDRFLRRPDEAEKVIDLAEEIGGLHVVTFTGPPIDLMTPSGQLMLRQAIAFARYEMQHKGARQRSKARELAATGTPKWKTAFGFTEDGTHKAHPIEGPMVAQAYADILAGRTIYGITKEWNEKGMFGRRGTPWTTATLSLFLRKPINAGLRAHNGVIVGPGQWDALVDETTWRAAQTILNAPERKPGPKSVRVYLLSNLLLCGKCDDADYKLSGQPKKPYEPKPDRPGKTGPKPQLHNRGRDLYQCKSCFGVTIRKAKADDVVLAALVKRLSRPDARELLHDGETPDLDKLRREADAIREGLKDIAVEEADEKVNAKIEGREPKSKAEFQAARERLTTRLKAAESKTVDGTKAHVFRDIPLGTDQVAAALEDFPDDRLRAIIAATVRITVMPAGPVKSVFDPTRLKFDWN